MLDFEQALLFRQSEIRRRVDAVSRAKSTLTNVKVAERGLNAEDWERLGDLEARALAEREAVDRALERLKHGSFGLCEECGEPLSFLRLESEPWAARCEECEGAG